MRPFYIESFSRLVALPAVSTATGRYNQLPGRDFHPLKNHALSRRTVHPPYELGADLVAHPDVRHIPQICRAERLGGSGILTLGPSQDEADWPRQAGQMPHCPARRRVGEGHVTRAPATTHRRTSFKRLAIRRQTPVPRAPSRSRRQPRDPHKEQHRPRPNPPPHALRPRGPSRISEHRPDMHILRAGGNAFHCAGLGLRRFHGMEFNTSPRIRESGRKRPPPPPLPPPLLRRDMRGLSPGGGVDSPHPTLP